MAQSPDVMLARAAGLLDVARSSFSRRTQSQVAERSKTTPRDPKQRCRLHRVEAVARHGCVHLTAQKVCVSASAITHRVREWSTAPGLDLLGCAVLALPIGPGFAQDGPDELAFSIDNMDTSVDPRVDL